MVLRKLEEKDVCNMLEWMHDPVVTCNFRADFKHMTIENANEFIKNSFSEKHQHFAIVNEEDEYMGTISLKNISYQDKNAEYAIVTTRQAWGSGLAYQATKEILDYAFLTLELHRIYLNVLEENVRANKFYLKCGFQFEGTFVDHVCTYGKYKNLNWYGILKLYEEN